MKNTLGPWLTEKSGSVIWIGTPRSSGQKVDEIVTHIDIDFTYKTEVIEKKLANAKLIAAAPELLEACIKARSAFLTSEPEYDLLTEVIEKATGHKYPETTP